MRVIYTADLHGIETLYNQLLSLVRYSRPDIIIIGGDLLPKDGPFESLVEKQHDFIRGFLKQALVKIKNILRETECYVMMGNDDFLVNLPALEALQNQGLLKLLHSRKYLFKDGFEVIGYRNVPPTPFSNKDNERIDTPDAAREPQYYAACASTPQGLKTIDAESYFQSKPTVEEELRALPVPESYQRAVYVMHAPPFRSGLDTLFDGRPIGSHAIRDFIEKNQPYLTLHGHIHEAPLVSGIYSCKIGNTHCVNPGQGTTQLHAVSFELPDIESTLRHTILGPGGGGGR